MARAAAAGTADLGAARLERRAPRARGGAAVLDRTGTPDHGPHERRGARAAARRRRSRERRSSPPPRCSTCSPATRSKRSSARAWRRGAPALFGLSVTGGVQLDPVDPGDHVFEAAFNDHQRRTAARPAPARAGCRRGGDRPLPVRGLVGARGGVAVACSMPRDRALVEEWLRGWLDGRGRGATGPAGVGRRVRARRAPPSSPPTGCASSCTTRTSWRGRHDAAVDERPPRRGSAPAAVRGHGRGRPSAPASSLAILVRGGRGAVPARLRRRSRRRPIAAAMRSPRWPPPPPPGDGGSWRRASGFALGWRESVSAYYRSQFLNTVLPGGVVGDVHRAVVHGRSVEQVAQAARAVAAERAVGQAVQLVLARRGAGVDRILGLRSGCGDRARGGRRRLRRQ